MLLSCTGLQVCNPGPGSSEALSCPMLLHGLKRPVKSIIT